MAKVKKNVVTVDQRKTRERRANDERREAPQEVSQERRLGPRREKVARRRQIDPTTCERDYTTEEIEFMHALEQYKRQSGRMFPTCSEVLEVLRGLGYEKSNRSQLSAQPSGEPVQVGASDLSAATLA